MMESSFGINRMENRFMPSIVLRITSPLSFGPSLSIASNSSPIRFCFDERFELRGHAYARNMRSYIPWELIWLLRNKQFHHRIEEISHQTEQRLHYSAGGLKR